MKKFYLLLCIVFTYSSLAYSQSLEESFDYNAGDSLGAHGWVHISPTGTGTLNRLLVTSPGLDFIGYQLPGVGNATTLLNTGQDSYKQLSSNASSGSIYAFFIVNVTAAQVVSGIGDYFVSFLSSTSITNFTCRIYIRKMTSASSNFAFGITKNAISGGAVLWSDSSYTVNTKYLLCAKYTFNSGTNTDDQVSLFVFSTPPPASEPTPTLGPVTSTSTDVADIGRFALRQGAPTLAPSLNLDEIYVGTTWSATLPVELSSFTSSVNKRDVVLNWTTNSETNNSGFAIERSSANTEWTNVGNVAGHGTVNTSNNYSFTDKGLPSGNYNYRLKQIDYNGNFEYFNLNNEVNVGIPVKFDVSQNYPNPFNPSTKINYDLPVDGKVSLKIFDISGKEIVTLVNEVKTAGYYSVDFNASDLSSGVYFYSLSVNNFSATKRMLLVK